MPEIIALIFHFKLFSLSLIHIRCDSYVYAYIICYIHILSGVNFKQDYIELYHLIPDI